MDDMVADEVDLTIWHLKEVHGHKSVTTTQAYATSLSSKQLEVEK